MKKLNNQEKIPEFYIMKNGIETKYKLDDFIDEYRNKGYEPLKLRNIEQLDIIASIKVLYKYNLLEKINIQCEEIKNNPLNYVSKLHGFMHIQRVNIIANILSILGNLNKQDRNILLTAVKFHDIGRINDDIDTEHGKRSASKLRKNISYISEYSTDDQELILFGIEQHSKSELENKRAINQLPQEKQSKYSLMLNYLKDSDKLDRVRLGKKETVNINRLVLLISKQLVLAAYQLETHHNDIIYKYIPNINMLQRNS